MIVVGLTGSIAMGKTETARMFRELGIPVFDADAEVHGLYGMGGEAVAPIAALFPHTVTDGSVDRARLSAMVVGDEAALKMLEAIVHPLVRRRQQEFLETQRRSGARVAIIDHPLLFETGLEQEMDAVVVVSARAEMQRERALKRPGMTVEKLEMILARQLPDAEKRRRADFIVDTSRSLDDTARQVREIAVRLEAWRGKGKHAGNRP